jgi:hypothetical protein
MSLKTFQKSSAIQKALWSQKQLTAVFRSHHDIIKMYSYQIYGLAIDVMG